MFVSSQLCQHIPHRFKHLLGLFHLHKTKQKNPNSPNLKIQEKTLCHITRNFKIRWWIILEFIGMAYAGSVVVCKKFTMKLRRQN